MKLPVDIQVPMLPGLDRLLERAAFEKHFPTFSFTWGEWRLGGGQWVCEGFAEPIVLEQPAPPAAATEPTEGDAG